MSQNTENNNNKSSRNKIETLEIDTNTPKVVQVITKAVVAVYDFFKSIFK